MRAFIRLLLPLAAAALSAQGARPALDVLPDKTLGFLLFRDPVLSQVKLQGLMQRTGMKGDDPLTGAQKAFGLAQLPAGRQGLAIVYLEDAAPGAGGSQREVLYLSPPDCAAFLAKLHAVPKEKGFFDYKAGGRAYAATLRDGWVLLAEANAKAQLKHLAAAPPLRGSLGALAGWMEGEEAYGALTPRGLWSLFNEAKKAASGVSSGRSSASGVDGFVDKAEAELSLLAFRGHLDENGNLSASVRARLNPNGAWMSMGRDLPLADGYGISQLPKTPYAMALGGAIPHAWMDELANMSLAPVRARLSAQGVADSDLAPIDDAAKREGAHVQGFAFLMPALGSAGMLGMRMALRVDDSRAYETDMKAQVEAYAVACRTKNLPVPLRFASSDQNGLRSFGPVTDPDPEDESGPQVRYVALDGETVAATLGRQDQLAQLGAPLADGGLSDDEGIRRTADLLPKEGTFFAFFNFGALFQQQAASMKQLDATLPSDLATGLPPIPEAPDCPPLGLSLRFDLDRWDLSVALPLETQLALGRTQEAMTKAQTARMNAFREKMKRQDGEQKPQDLRGGATGKPDEDGDKD